MSVGSRIIALGSTTSRNRIGRAFSLWLTARHAGLKFEYYCVDDGPIWEPLQREHEFRATLHTAQNTKELRQLVADAVDPDATLVVCKPRPELIRLTQTLAHDLPVIVDIDDPELVDPWQGSPLLLRAKRIVRFGPSQFRFGWARRAVTRMNVITSNPLLQELYPGFVVPHVREAISLSPAGRRRSDVFTIGFIGTLREHKGIQELRDAVADLARTRVVRLCITAEAPLDARPWEEWVGQTSLEEGRALLGGCDAVAILSRPGPWGDLQLPVKLIDAMAIGVPAVITPRQPLLWATGGSAIVVRDDSVRDLRDAFALLADDPVLGAALASAAWQRARTMFTPAAAAPDLLEAVERSRAAAR